MSGDLPRFSATITATDVSFSWNGRRYRTGDSYHTDDACDFVGFVDRIRREAEGKRGEKKLTDPGDQYKVARRECWLSRLGVLDNAAVIAPANPAGAQPGTDDPPPSEETAETLGAQDPAEAAELGLPPDAPDVPEFLKDALGTLSADEVRALYDRLKSQGLSDDDIRKLYEHNEPKPGQAHGDHAEPGGESQLAAGDPVLLATGQFEFRVTDVEIVSAGFPIRLTRVHRSGPSYLGPWGYNWDHPYNQFLRPLTDGSYAHWTGDIREHLYMPRLDGAFEPPVGVPKRFSIERDAAGVESRWLIEAAEGWRWEFRRPAGWPSPDRIPLVAISDRHGTRHELRYNAEGRLSDVRDEWGRGLQFTYGSCGLVEKVADHNGRVWQYWHDEDAEHLIRVVTPAVAASPSGVATCYEYADRQTMPPRTQGIRWVADEQGRAMVENEYGAPDDPDAAGRVVRQMFKGSMISYRYVPVQFVPAVAQYVNAPVRRTEVRREGEGMRVYTFNFRGDLIEERFRLMADNSYRVVVFSARYDAAGNLAEQYSPDGSSVLRVFDAQADDPRERSLLREVWLRAGPLAPATSRRVLSASYDKRFQLVKTVTDEAGAVTTLAYDHESGFGTGALVQIGHPATTLSDGTVQTAAETFQSDARGRWIKRTTPEGTVHTRQYAAGNGSDAGLLIEDVADAAGTPRVRRYSYDPLSRVHTMANERGAITTYERDALDRLVRVVLPEVAGVTAEHRFGYDSAGNLVSEQHPRGAFADSALTGDHITSVHEYDAWNRRVASTIGVASSAPRRWSWQWDPEDRLIRTVDPLGRVDSFRYDERGRLLMSTLADGAMEEQIVRYRYDRTGRLRFLDRLNGSTEHSYDAWGRPRQTTGPDGTTTRFSYGQADRTVRITIASGGALLADRWFDYDEAGRLRRSGHVNLSASGIAGPDLVSSFIPDREGRIVRHTGPYGDVGVTDYGPLGEIVRTLSATGDQVEYDYDAAGNAVVIRNIELADNGNQTLREVRFGYDARDRLTEIVDPMGNRTTFAYDDRDLTVEVVDPAGQSARYRYGLAGELTAAERDRDDGTVAVTRFTLDAKGRPVERIDANGAVTQVILDLLDREREVIWPNGMWKRWTYHPAGHISSIEDSAGIRREQQIDVVQRRQTWTFTATATADAVAPTVFEADGLGRLVRALVGTTEVTRDYDTVGRLVREALDGRAVDIAYDDVAHTVTRTFPSGRTDHTMLDPAGRVREIRIGAPGPATGMTAGQLVARYSYASSRRIDSRTLASGSITSYTHDAASRLSSIKHVAGNGTVLAERWYVSDALGQRRVIGTDAAGNDSQWVTYDTGGRLTGLRYGVVSGPPPVPGNQADADAFLAGVDPSTFTAREQFDVDDADNIRSREVRDASDTVVDTAAFGYDALGTLTGAGLAAVSSDAGGNLAADGTRRFVHDALGRLTRVEDTVTGAVLLRQSYDALGRVASRQSGGRTWHSVYAGEQLVAQEDAGTWREITSGVSVGEVLCVSEAGTDIWLHHDAVQTLLAATDATGNAIARFDYSAYGIAAVTDGAGQPLAVLPSGLTPVFGGHPYDRDAGLYLARTRAYEPRWARFLQRDPSSSDSASPYIYAAGDPVNHFDPSGAALPAPGTTAGSGDGARAGTPGGFGTGKPHELAWYERAALAAAGAVEAVTDIFIEAGKQVYDMAGLYVQWFGLETGLYDFDFRPVSGIAKMADQGMGTGDILAGMGRNIVETPQRLWHAIESEDYRAFGREAVNIYMLARPVATTGAKLAGRLRGGTAPGAGAGAAETLSAEMAAEADAMNLTQVVRGTAGQRGIGVIYVRSGAYTAAQMRRIISAVTDMDFQAGMAGGLVRQAAAPLRKIANAIARFARGSKTHKVLELGPDEAAGHIPDGAAGGSPLGPIMGLPKKFNSSLGGQWGRYGQGFVFEGFSLLDDVTGQPIYSSLALEAAPPPMPRTWGRPLR